MREERKTSDTARMVHTYDLFVSRLALVNTISPLSQEEQLD
jgi:hypothetical protein